jgi:hypothetical protein
MNWEAVLEKMKAGEFKRNSALGERLSANILHLQSPTTTTQFW